MISSTAPVIYNLEVHPPGGKLLKRMALKYEPSTATPSPGLVLGREVGVANTCLGLWIPPPGGIHLDPRCSLAR